MILLTNSKFSILVNKVNFPVFSGNYNDFSPSWYYHVGTVIISSVTINIFLPHLFAIINYLFIQLKRCSDGGYRCDGHMTGKHTRKDYFDLYIGGEFNLDYRYSNVNII